MSRRKYLSIALDFDGTLATHEWPSIGIELENMVNVLKRVQEKGHKLVLNTMRSGKELDESVEWCKDRGIELYGVNFNPDQESWTTSPKVFANLYIDDAALGVKLDYYTDGTRPSVNWFWVEEMLERNGII